MLALRSLTLVASAVVLFLPQVCVFTAVWGSSAPGTDPSAVEIPKPAFTHSIVHPFNKPLSYLLY